MSTARPTRRSLLTWSGVGAFVVATGGFGACPAGATIRSSVGSSPTASPTASPTRTPSLVPEESLATAGWGFDPLLGLFVQPAVAEGAAVAWEFDTDGDAEGWEPTNGVADFTVADGTLRTTVTGFDPYLFAPTVGLNGRRDRLLHLRARLAGADGLKLYFATEESPDLAEGKALALDLPGDGEFHEVVLDLGAANELWRTGTVTTVRLDIEPATSEGAVLEVDFVRIEQLGARLVATMFAPDLGSVRPGETVHLRTTLSNVGGAESAAFPARLTVPDHLEAGSPEEQNVPALAPGEETELSWTVRVRTPLPAPAVLDLAADGTPFRFGTVVAAVPDVTLPDRRSPRGVSVRRDRDGNVVLQNKDVRLSLLATEKAIVQGVLDLRVGKTWRRMASAQPLTWLAVQGTDGPELLCVTPSEVRLTEGDPSRVGLTGDVEASDGTRWRIELQFSLGADDAAVRATYAATPDRDAPLLAFRGPSLTVGERSFGGEQDRALFPGLEWLVEGERSSSTLDADPPINLRSTPHPLKVTVPLLAILRDGGLVSLQWDADQTWDGTRKQPAAQFASPNWIDGQDNHALTVFVPDVEAYVAENGPWATVDVYTAEAGRRLEVRADFVVSRTDDVLMAVEHWYDMYGLPSPAPAPRTWEEEIDLIRDAYVTSYWDPEVKGWPHVYGWESAPFVPLAAVLQITGLLTSDAEGREAAFARVREFTENVLTLNGERALGALDGAHIEMLHAPFYLGHLEGALPKWREYMDGRLAGQEPDGSWRFDPGDDPIRQRLGEKGAEALGLTAVPTQRILRWARMTGDRDALAAGLKALAYMEKFDVPRAAQTWECPVHTPDVLASAYGVGAYVEGYRLTGDRRYSRRAEYWARTGLPFLYTWAGTDRPMMPYGSIPVFGTSVFTNPWFGRPVQWNGLVYAYFLLDMLEAVEREPAFPWRQVAEGVVVSAMLQQRTTEPGKGGYPDSWELRENVPVKGVDINPEGLAKPAIMVMGKPTDVQTRLLRRAGETARLSTAARITGAEWDGSRLTARLDFYDGATSQLLLVGVPAPTTVRVDGRGLDAVPSLDAPDVAEGWKQLADGSVIAKLRHAETSTLEVEFR